MQSLRNKTVWLATCALAAAACGAPSRPAATEVVVTTRALRYEPAAFTWQVGREVRLLLRNPDAVEHDFVVDGLRFVAARGASHAGHAAHGGHSADAAGGSSLHLHAAPFSEVALTFTPQSAGTFTVYCSVTGHREAGMTATLTVR